MAAATSVQLPDLLSLGREFELRTNRQSHTVISASEKWFMTEQNGLSEAEKSSLRSMNIGVGLPHVSRPLVVCNCRLARAQSLRECGWTDELPAGNLPCLAGNDLFRDFVHNVACTMPSRENFNKSTDAFRAAQMQVMSHR
ncbi:Alpha-muurolene synthase [Mycena venus]|uniref:Alpha-muurolene synthase n=1 Tax=Mycena venus TaxID=2733690 RepID=A0A8H6WU20_9AGAR|nr:Alpha-muurolene synthase [Mycena venus]